MSNQHPLHLVERHFQKAQLFQRHARVAYLESRAEF